MFSILKKRLFDKDFGGVPEGMPKAADLNLDSGLQVG
jgi:hypothetical protein